MERRGLKSIRALAKVTGEDWSRVAGVLKLPELPVPILIYLRTHDSPTTFEVFTERRLRDLLGCRDPRRIRNRFQALLRESDARA